MRARRLTPPLNRPSPRRRGGPGAGNCPGGCSGRCSDHRSGRRAGGRASAPPVPAPVAEAAPAQEAPKKASWLSRLKQGLSRTGQSIGGLFVGVKVDENLFEELESALIMADAGLEATEALLTAARA